MAAAGRNPVAPESDRPCDAAGVRKATHDAPSSRFGDDIEQLRFNRAVSRVYDLSNKLSAAVGAIDTPEIGDDLRFAVREAVDILVQLFAPMMPHLAESCWKAIGHDELVAERPWPVADPSLVREDVIILPVQVNGKKRADVTVGRDAGKDEIEAATLALDAVQRALDGKPVKKFIVVPQRIVNVVA